MIFSVDFFEKNDANELKNGQEEKYKGKSTNKLVLILKQS